MAKKLLNSKQKEFCKLIVDGNLPAKAYAVAFKNNNKASVAVNANRLLKRAEIKSYLSEITEINKKIVEAANQKATDKIVEGSIADKTERLQILTSIARGELKIKTEKATNTGVEVVELTPEYADRRAAIAELNKMDGSYAAQKQDITTAGKEIRSWIVKSK